MIKRIFFSHLSASRLFTICSIFLFVFVAQTQTIPPPYINYQAVLYDVNGANPNSPLTNQSFSTFVNINDELGNLLYREEHYASTDANGLITVKMGDGLYTAGPITNFNLINWGVGKYYLVVDFDINGTISSTAPEQLVTVPYSFYAGKSGNGVSTITSNGNQTLTITYDNGTTYTTQALVGFEGPQGPAGAQGATGQSAYDLWLSQGNAGTVDDFLNASAYEIWLAQGNTGTQQDFLNTLVGPQGPQGVQGAAGPQGPIGLTGQAGAPGIQGIQGPAGSAGNDGQDGVGIVTTTSNNDGTVTFTYSDGTSSTLAVGTGTSGIVGNGYVSNISLSEFMNQASGSLRKVKVDNEGRINILGYFSGSLSIFDTTFVSTGQGTQHGVFLIQLSQQNTLNWAKYIGNTPNSGTVGLGDLGIDTMNNLYAGFASTLVKIDENGNLIWSKSFTNVIGVEVDSNQNILCLYGNLNFNLVKLSNVGNTIWNVGVGSTTLSSANADLSLAPNGDAFVLYNTSATSCLSGNTRVVVTKINFTNGSTLWTRTSTQNISATPCASAGLTLAIGSDNNGNCYVFSSAGTTIQISGITGSCLLISSSGAVTNVPSSWSGSSLKNTDPVCIPNGNDVYYISFNQQYSLNKNDLRLIKQTNTGSYESVIGIGEINLGPQSYISGLDFDSSNNLYLVIWNNGSIPLEYSAEVLTSVTNITGNSGLQILKITP